MARVTVEDCLKNVKNRFELVLIASKRARQLMRGKEAKVEWDNDKATVVALREIAAGYTNFESTSKEEERASLPSQGFVLQEDISITISEKEADDESETDIEPSVEPDAREEHHDHDPASNDE